ncbi:MAG: GDP-mannose pyrophosphatase, partial [Flavobacteriaceae bacterium]|nr:GDP-mannose pyrophosphatase [Flavobacteriaceae bacterium]
SYMSPGAVTEILHFFIAEYDNTMKKSEGGGAADEQEEIEVLEIPIDKAMDMIQTGEIKDAKTIMLLQHVKLHKIL